ncbi:6589_t:CDS:2, partial [Scutellospora calospora]
QKCGTLDIVEYSYLIPNQHQLCDQHYLLIVEPNRNYSKINEVFQNLQKTEKSSELKWDNIHLEILDDKIYIPKQDFLNLVSNIEYLQENQKDKIFEEIIEVSETINKNFENIDKNNISNNIGLHLASAGTSYRGIDILANTGLTVSSKTILRYKQQIVEDHFDKINKYFNEQ